MAFNFSKLGAELSLRLEDLSASSHSSRKHDHNNDSRYLRRVGAPQPAAKDRDLDFNGTYQFSQECLFDGSETFKSSLSHTSGVELDSQI
jgi:hypothetical protein